MCEHVSMCIRVYVSACIYVQCLRKSEISDPLELGFWWLWALQSCTEQNLEHTLNHWAIASAQDFCLLRQDLPLTILVLPMWTRVASLCQTPGAEILSLKPLTWPVGKNFVQDTGQPDELALAITILLGQFPVWISKLAKRNPRLEFASLSQQRKVTSFRVPSSQSGNNSVTHMACVSQESKFWRTKWNTETHMHKTG